MRRAKHTEHEILDFVRQRGWATYRQLINYFKSELIDPPHPVRVREKLVRLFMKGKLDRVKVKAFEFKHGVEFVYFLPDNPPEWLKEKVKKEDSNKRKN